MRPAPASRSRGFRWKFTFAMMLVVASITGSGLYLAQWQVHRAAEAQMERAFQERLIAWRTLQDARRDALTELARELARKPRLHAALEDNALDLLYPSARDELRDVMAADAAVPQKRKARFYRFLDAHGAPISAAKAPEAGLLDPADEARLALPALPRQQVLGYLTRAAGLDELISVPILSTENGEPIATLVLGFPTHDDAGAEEAGVRSGLWVDGRLHIRGLGGAALEQVSTALMRAAPDLAAAPPHLPVDIAGVPHLLLHRLLNPGSAYPRAHEIHLVSLAELLAREGQVRRNILAAGGFLLLLGLAGSHFAAGRLSAPVERLAEESEEHLAQRQVAESALEQTSAELQRTARFSADASHQLKTPVTVLRAGLEELLSREDLPAEVREELSTLVHQTHRLTGLINDLLLLARMDAGRLQLNLVPVGLAPLLEAALDDLSAQAEGTELAVETDYADDLIVLGEARYTGIILQNLLENARKYNEPGGRIRVAARATPDAVLVTVGNTGSTIPPAAQPHIFDRFHRGAAGENVPGHGLGLNLARELARLHGGELRLLTSADGWTEFEVRLCPAEGRA